MKNELRIIRAEGDAATRGKHIGRRLDSVINRSIEFYHRYFERRGVSSAQLQELLTPFMIVAEANTPEHMAMINGMAQGAVVPVLELFAVNAFEELEPLLKRVGDTPLFLERKEGAFHHSEHCSTFTVSAGDRTFLAHNEQWLDGDTGNVAVIVELPGEGRTATASPTYACCLAACGMNSHGGAQGIQSLTASDDRVGIPRVFVSRNSLESSGRADALQRATPAERAGGYGHSYAFSGDCFTIETTATRAAELDGQGPHTNHYLDPELAGMAPEPRDGSLARYNRMRTLLDERRPGTPEAIMDILRDHAGAPESICLHADEADGDDAEAVVFSMVCDVDEGRMWVAPGTPCDTPYEEVDLTGVR
ncbi:MAG: C45 family peptidase [Actinomycetota bacterium]